MGGSPAVAASDLSGGGAGGCDVLDAVSATPCFVDFSASPPQTPPPSSCPFPLPTAMVASCALVLGDDDPSRPLVMLSPPACVGLVVLAVVSRIIGPVDVVASVGTAFCEDAWRLA